MNWKNISNDILFGTYNSNDFLVLFKLLDNVYTNDVQFLQTINEYCKISKNNYSFLQFLDIIQSNNNNYYLVFKSNRIEFSLFDFLNDFSFKDYNNSHSMSIFLNIFLKIAQLIEIYLKNEIPFCNFSFNSIFIRTNNSIILLPYLKLLKYSKFIINIKMDLNLFINFFLNLFQKYNIFLPIELSNYLLNFENKNIK